MASYIRLFLMYLMALLYIVAGVLHFVKPEFYLAIMPRYLPYHLELVYLSGVAEILCGLLLFSKKTQALGAWLTIALLIAVCKSNGSTREHRLNPFLVDPANIQMAQDYFAANHPQRFLSLARLPFQFVLIWWAYQYTKPVTHQKKA